MRVELATALGLAEVDSVGGTIADAAEARGFAERFQQDWAQVVAALAVAEQAAFDLGELAGVEVRATSTRDGSGSLHG